MRFAFCFEHLVAVGHFLPHGADILLELSTDALPDYFHHEAAFTQDCIAYHPLNRASIRTGRRRQGLTTLTFASDIPSAADFCPLSSTVILGLGHLGLPLLNRVW